MYGETEPWHLACHPAGAGEQVRCTAEDFQSMSIAANTRRMALDHLIMSGGELNTCETPPDESKGKMPSPVFPTSPQSRDTATRLALPKAPHVLSSPPAVYDALALMTENKHLKAENTALLAAKATQVPPHAKQVRFGDQGHAQAARSSGILTPGL
jgi:hypothetical protein